MVINYLILFYQLRHMITSIKQGLVEPFRLCPPAVISGMVNHLINNCKNVPYKGMRPKILSGNHKDREGNGHGLICLQM